MRCEPTHEEMERCDTDAAAPQHLEQEALAVDPQCPRNVQKERDDNDDYDGREASASLAELGNVPEHLIPLAHQINTLKGRDLLHIAEITEYVVTRDVYSTQPYRGSSWFLPEVLDVKDGDVHRCISCLGRRTLSITVGKRRFVLPLVRMTLCFLIVTVVWFTLWNMLPHSLLEPGGYIWDTVSVIIVSSFIGGLICRLLRLPTLVGVLWVAIAWNNIPQEGYLTSGIGLGIKDISAKLGLTVVMVRAGFSTSLSGISLHWKHTVALALIPFAFETVAHTLIAGAVFQYDSFTWSVVQGSICSIVSPAVVVPGVLYLQNMGYSRGPGPCSLMVSAVGIEVAVGVWLASMFMERIFAERTPLTSALLGAAQFAGGTVGGVVLGIIFFYIMEFFKGEVHRLPNGKMQKKDLHPMLDLVTFLFLAVAALLVFLGYALKLAGGGCIACVLFASTMTHMCLRQANPELTAQRKYIGKRLAQVWDGFMMPLLFAMMGTKLSATSVFSSDFFPKALLCFFGSTTVRLVVIFAVLVRSGLSLREKLLVCVGYCGKASAQASLGPVAAAMVASAISALPTGEEPSADLLRKEHYADNVQQVTAMYVMFLAVVASVGLMRGGLALFRRENAAGEGAREQDSGEQRGEAQHQT